MEEWLANLIYVAAAALFILGLKGLGHPRTAVRGNLMTAAGMLIAIVVTLLDREIVGYWVIAAGLAVGGLIGAVLALKIAMTAVPQMVALFNGFGGGASALVAGAAVTGTVLIGIVDPDESPTVDVMIATVASGIIGGVTFWGSMVAFGKLQGLVTERPVLLPGRYVVMVLLALSAVSLGAWLVVDPSRTELYWAIVALAAVLGIMLTVPIGGADMPVVISLLNSYSGLAGAATGFVLNNNVLIIAGSLVGAAGLILTTLMCKAMNRSLVNVLFGGLGATASTREEAQDIYANVKSTSAEEVGMLLEAARRVVIVPGYGMAVGQAQHAVRELTNLLETKGTEVEFGIHPVAGRMPGHMNVLLAEADTPYDKLKEMDEINPTFKQTDVVLVIGANDIVNPMARDSDPSIPIAGMPILDVDQATVVVVIKRSLSPGFAGITNPLFAADNTLMLYGDAKKVATDLVASVKEM
jgi:NAD(P) transhydrogenase subunit beta